MSTRTIPARRDDPRRILVAGGGGFIGSQLCRRLLAQGHEVICLDDFSAGTRANIEALIGAPRFTLLRQDVVRTLDLDVEQIYNLVSPSDGHQARADSLRRSVVRVCGTQNLLRLARRRGATMLQTSPGERVADIDELRLLAGDGYGVEPIGPRALHDDGRRCAEALCLDQHRQHGVAVKIARVFDTYGPAMALDGDGIVASFITQALSDRSLTVRGDGRGLQAVCHVDDVIDGLIALMNSEPTITGPVNLGSPQAITTFELAQRVVSAAHSASSIRIVAAPGDEVPPPDITNAQVLLGWEPRVDLDRGLVRTLKDVRQRLKLREAQARARQRKASLQAVPLAAGSGAAY